jgi:tetratricopeptide (TPR) repeat protein
MSPEQAHSGPLDRRTDMRAGAAPADASVPAPASMADAEALPAGRRGRRRAAAQAGRGWRVVLLAALGALVVAGLMAYDFLHLRRTNHAPEPVTATGVPAPSSSAAALPVPPAAVPPPVAASAPAQALAGSPADSRPVGSAGEAATRSPRPEASLAERTTLLERAQAAFDEGNLDRAHSEAHRAAALGNREADALLGAIAFKRGHLDEAERLLSKALQRDPGNSRIARQLQVVRAKQGK